MSFLRQGLHFREVELRDLETLREHRNTHWSGYRDPRPIMNMTQENQWYNSLGHENMAFIVEDVDNDHTLSPVGLLRIARFDHENRSAELVGVDVFDGHTGKGYASQILRAAAEWLIYDLGYHRVKGECTPENVAMTKALDRAGFIQEGRMRSYIWRDGKWHDFLQYSLLADELGPDTEG